MSKFSKKVCLLGDFAVGKTSLVRRFVYNMFEDKYISTIGVKVSRKKVAVPYQGSVAELTIMLWDLAGSEEFSQMQASYLRGAAGAVLVCDLTRLETLDGLYSYAENMLKVNSNAKFIIAANKSDLTAQHQLTPEQVELAATELESPYYLTSAKLGDEVDLLFRHLGELLIT